MRDLLAMMSGFVRNIGLTAWIAIGALFVSLFSAWQAFRSRRIAERGYRLSLDAHYRSQPSLDLYLIEAYIRPIADPPRRVCIFKLRITNQSDSPNSISAVTLRVDYRRPHEPGLNVIVPHDPTYAAVLIERDGAPLQVPQGIQARTVTGGAALFPVPDDLIQQAQIDSYTVAVVDSFNRVTEQEAILLREVRN
jgi:hypothetical protein